VPSTDPVADYEIQSLIPSPSPPPAPENCRGTNGLWRFPNGEWHPRNLNRIYDSDGRLREASLPLDNYKGADGRWHYPDGQLHPRNIYGSDGPTVYDDTDNNSYAE